MKNILVYTKAVVLIAIFFAACKKNDGPTPFDLARVPQVQVVKVQGTDGVIDVLNLGGFEGKFTVGTYYANDIKPEKMDVVIMKNGVAANVKVFKTDVTAFPSEYTITTAELEALFGAPIELNDRYDIGGDVYIGGNKYQAFPLTGIANGGGAATQPGASPFTRYAAVCAYDPSIYEGDFEVVEDEFADTAPGDIVTLTRIDDTHFSYIYPSGINPLPIIVTVNPLTNATSITKQKFGDAFTWQPAYTNPNAATVASVDNVVLPCDKSFSVLINYTVDQGNFGNYKFTLKKVE